MHTVTGYPLIEALSRVPDFRKSRGKRHPLVAILALAVAAVLCGYDNLTAISQWGREHGEALLAPLGFRHFPGPCVATLHRVFRRVDVMALEHVLTDWLNCCLPAEGGLALDGKTLRGSRDDPQDPVQLLAAFAHTLGTALGQQPIRGKNEVAAALELLQSLDLTGWIVTADAGFTHKTVAETIVQQGGDYVLTVKKNQPTLYADIALLFEESAVVRDTITSTRQLNVHGNRGEERILQASTALQDYCPWPGLQQVFRIERHFTDKQTGRTTCDTDFGITSLSAERADAQRLANLVRGHWGIENRLHWVRDVTFNEDASHVRSDHAPQTMAALRNVAISLIRLLGCDGIAPTLRHFAAHPAKAVAVLALPPSSFRRLKMK